MVLLQHPRYKLFGKLLIVFFSILLVFTVGSYYLVRKNIENNIKREEQRVARLLSNKASDIVQQLKTDIEFLGSELELFYDTDVEHFAALTESLFLKYASVIKVYNQIRFINPEGQELVRVEFDNDSARVVSKEQLQNKKSRYYFDQIIDSGKDNIYVSPMDLNIENGMVSTPYEPVIRVGTKLYGKNNRLIGVIITNFNAESLLQIIRNSQNGIGDKFLLNHEGHYLLGPNSEKEWGFMFNKQNNNFFYDFKEESSVIFNHNSGIVSSANGLFVFSTINIDSKPQDSLRARHIWKLITYISHSGINSIVYGYFKKGVGYAVFISIVIILLLWILSGSIYHRQKAQKALENSNKALEEIIRTKDKFFSIISHDLRSPFTGIIGYSHMLKSGLDSYSPEEVKNFVSYINRSAENTYKMLDNLLKWARVQSGKIEPVPELFQLKDMLIMLKASFESTLIQKELSLVYKCHKDFKVFADKMMIRTVIHNLISNAIKFTPRGGSISINVSQEYDMIRIDIIDTGVGMSKEAIRKLFKIDSMSSTKGTEEESGTGLGLILTKEFIDINNGSINVNSEIDKGTTFSILLPVKLPQKRR